MARKYQVNDVKRDENKYRAIVSSEMRVTVDAREYPRTYLIKST